MGMKNLLFVFGMSVLLFLAFWGGLYTAGQLCPVRKLCRTIAANMEYSQKTKRLIDAIINDMKKNPRETGRKLERLQETIVVFHKDFPLDDYLLQSGFEVPKTDANL